MHVFLRRSVDPPYAGRARTDRNSSGGPVLTGERTNNRHEAQHVPMRVQHVRISPASHAELIMSNTTDDTAGHIGATCLGLESMHA
jgi:hypothetical protein